MPRKNDVQKAYDALQTAMSAQTNLPADADDAAKDAAAKAVADADEALTKARAAQASAPVTDPTSPDFDKSVYDETVPGGRIIVDGRTVNADGEPI